MKTFEVFFTLKGDEFSEEVNTHSAKMAEEEILDSFFEARIISVKDKNEPEENDLHVF